MGDLQILLGLCQVYRRRQSEQARVFSAELVRPPERANGSNGSTAAHSLYVKSLG